MRYMNWDVLLFPDGSKTPLQEFRTLCDITRDPGTQSKTLSHAPPLPRLESSRPDPASSQHADRNDLSGSYSVGMPIYLPTVSSFVPSMPLGSPLKVSIHSWEAPIASPDTVTLAQQADWIWFEACVLLDGFCVARVWFNQQAGWPQIIDTCSYSGKDGRPSPLTFPAFHPELLTQSHWNAGENFGRIKIVIAEGIARGQGSAFEKIRSIVCFSFQHAPLRILEESRVAFPNPGMLQQVQNQIYGLSSPRKVQEPDPDAHGHSPRRQNTVNGVQTRMVYQEPIAATASPRKIQSGHPSYWPQLPPFYDAIPSHSRYQVHGRPPTLSSSGDQSMPDYSHSSTKASSRDLSDDQEHPDSTVGVLTNVGSIFDSCYYSPNRLASNGTMAPANTRVSSATNTPAPKNRTPSAAAKADSSNIHLRSVSVTTRDPAKGKIRETSDTSMHSHFSDLATDQGEATEGHIKQVPAKDVKGRKEGKVSELDFELQLQRNLSRGSAEHPDKENIDGSEHKSSGSSDGKRKRSTASLSTISKVLGEGHSTSSPSRKVSRVNNLKDQDLDDLTPEGVVTRAAPAGVASIV